MPRTHSIAALAAAVLIGAGSTAMATNPVITSIYTADPAALVWNNTLYVHAGHDEAPPGGTNFVMRDWHVLSSTDANTWTDNGARLAISNFAWAGADAWAGEVEPRDGKFYWYVPVNGNGPGWMDIAVAVGDSPLGPFRDAKGRPLISDSTPNSSPLNIDPTVLVDDDGQAYLYWGSYYGVRAAKLKPNMVELDGPVVTPQGLTNFWEAPWLFKRNGVYYHHAEGGPDPGHPAGRVGHRVGGRTRAVPVRPAADTHDVLTFPGQYHSSAQRLNEE